MKSPKSTPAGDAFASAYAAAVSPWAGAGRVMFIRAPKRLEEKQLKLALGGLAEDHPVWLAFNQLIDEELASAMLDVSARTAESREHAAGRIEACATLKQRLLAHAGRLPVQ